MPGANRGEIANAREVFNEVKLGKDRGAQAENHANPNKVLNVPVLEKRFDLSL